MLEVVPGTRYVQENGAGGEIQLTATAMARFDRPSAVFIGLAFDRRRFDCGDQAGFSKPICLLPLARE